MNFFTELKRRNVVRVGIAYVVAAWLLLQLTEVLTELLEIGPDVGKIVIVLLIVGFIPAVIFAWAFELTPEGVKREKDVDRSRSIAPTTGRKLDRVIIGVLAVALAWFAWDKFGGTAPAPTPQVAETQTSEAVLEKSIAVLPFVNMSGNSENEYFSDGLSEELLNLLARVNGLKVAARTSSFKFKGADADISEIGNALNVATVLEGSVRRSGNQARITAQLIKVDDGFHLWSETYDRELDNIFEVQDEIATAIVDALKLPLLGQENAPLKVEQTTDFKAYDLYLLGRYRMNEFSDENMRAAIGYFQRVIEIDPDYAPAWAQLATAYLVLQDYGNLDFAEAMRLSEEAIDRALELEPGLADALNAQAMRFNYLGLRGRAAELYEQVLLREPSNVQALRGLSQVLSTTESERKLELARRALALDPLSETLQQRVIIDLSGVGRMAEAEALAEQLLAESPDNAGVHEGLGVIYKSRKMLPEAIRAYELTWKNRPGDVFPAWQLVDLYLSIGDIDSARHWVEAAQRRGGEESNWAFIAEQQTDLYAGLYESVLARARQRFPAEATVPAQGHFLLARVAFGMGDLGQALNQARTGLARYPQDQPGIRSDFEAFGTAYLAGLLNAGPEKARLAQRLETYASALTEVRPWDAEACVMLAVSAALQADREMMLAHLEQCKQLGWVDSQRARRHPAFTAYLDDPGFTTILLEMDAAAKAIRADLARDQEMAGQGL